MAEQPQSINNMNDRGLRKAWKIGSQVEIFSDSKQKWLKGKISKIINDEQGEWLIIKYAGFSLKEIQRFNTFIRPIIKKNEQHNENVDEKIELIGIKEPEQSVISDKEKFKQRNIITMNESQNDDNKTDLKIPEMLPFQINYVSDTISTHTLIQRMDNLVNLVENANEIKNDKNTQDLSAIFPQLIIDKVDMFCSSLHESLMDDAVVNVPKFKFMCTCGAKFIGDFVGKFTQEEVVCNECNIRCKSLDWLWKCSNTNYKHYNGFCLCVNCGDKWIQNEMYVNKNEYINDMKENELLSEYICDCGGMFIETRTNKCFGCDKFLDTRKLHCNKCGNTYGYSISIESMDILCGNCARNQMGLNDISHQPFEQKFTLSTDTVEELGTNSWQTDSSRNLQVGYNFSNNYKSQKMNNSGNGFDNIGFVMNNNQDNELQVMMKLSYLQARISELFNVKLEITSLFELKDHKDFKMQSKKEQATIMEIIDMLKDMKNMSPQYYQQYSRQNKWAQHLLDTLDNILFNDNTYDAFND